MKRSILVFGSDLCKGTRTEAWNISIPDVLIGRGQITCYGNGPALSKCSPSAEVAPRQGTGESCSLGGLQGAGELSTVQLPSPSMTDPPLNQVSLSGIEPLQKNPTDKLKRTNDADKPLRFFNLELTPQNNRCQEEKTAALQYPTPGEAG